MNRRLVLRAWLALALCARVNAGAQFDSVQRVLPPDVAREAVRLFNATKALRSTERVDIGVGRVIKGDVAVLNGPITLAGRITGRLLAINSDVILQAGAQIDGDLLVVGGEVEGAERARISGEMRVYHPSLRYSQSGEDLVADEQVAQEDQWWRRFDLRGRRNFNQLNIASAGPFNRVEGLPIRVGPALYRDQGWGHLRFDATAILRTASSFSGSSSDVGHDVRGEIRAGREYGVTLGTRLFDVVDGVETWQLSNAEVGLASFLFHRDYRDYFERHGGRIHAAIRATDDADLTLSYSHERWSSRATRDPFTLTRNDVPWRENPLVDESLFHLANLTLRVDTRNDRFNPFAGWYVLADYERGVGHIDQLGPASIGVRASTLGPTRYQRAFVDVRRYNRLTPGAALNLRVVAGGWLSGDPLPLERRLSIDGPGTIPAFAFRVQGGTDVGTCSSGGIVIGRPAQCERIALAQLEYRNDLRLSFTNGTGTDRHTKFRADGEWVFFADAGRGWLVNAPGSPLNYRRNEFPPLSTYRTDIGVGLDFDVFGVYVAKSLSQPSESAKFFTRIRHRF